MQEKCLKCEEVITDTDLKIICFKCRKYFSDEVKKFMLQGMDEEARKLISSAPLDDKWKRSTLEYYKPEFEQFIWRRDNEKRIQREKERKEQEFHIKGEWEKQEPERKKQEREKKRDEAIINHRDYLGSLGIPYRGISPPDMKKEKRHRTSHCWRCHELSLDNLVDAECNVCGWIICFCGGCGCGWKIEMIDKTGLQSVSR